MEPGRGITQPSLRLSAEYCTEGAIKENHARAPGRTLYLVPSPLEDDSIAVLCT